MFSQYIAPQVSNLEEKQNLVIKLITEQKVLVKMIQSTFDYQASWQFNFDSLNKPSTFRPVSTLDAKSDRTYIFNPVTGKEEKRDLTNKARGREKKTEYTKKTSVSLLPPNGKMHFFNVHHPVGLLYNIDDCKLSDKYIFASNMQTNSRWWIKGQPGYDDAKNNSLTTITELRKQHTQYIQRLTNNSATAAPNWNEILARLSKKSVIAIFAPEDNHTCRVNSLYRKYKAEEALNLTLPLLVITPTTGYRIYTDQDLIQDIKGIPIDHRGRSYNLTYEIFLELLLLENFKIKLNNIASRISNPSDSLKFILLAEDQKWEAAAALLTPDTEIATHSYLTKINVQLLKLFKQDDFFATTIGQSFLRNKHSPLLSQRLSLKPDLPVAFLKKYMLLSHHYQLGYLALQLASNESYHKLLKWVLMTHEVLHWRTSNSENILHLLLKKAKPDFELFQLVLKTSISQGLVTEKNKDDHLPIFYAVQNKHYEIIECWATQYRSLLKDTNLEFIINNLIFQENIKLANKLLKLSPPISADFNVILHSATESKVPNLNLISRLIDLDFSVMSKKNGVSSLDKILKYEPPIRIKLLKRIGYKLPPEVQGKILLELMKINPIEALTFFEVTPQINLTIADEKKSSVLDLALNLSPLKLEFIHALLTRGANLEIERADGTSPLSFILSKNLFAVIELILDKHLTTLTIPGLNKVLNHLFSLKAFPFITKIKDRLPDIFVDFKNETYVLHAAVNKKPWITANNKNIWNVDYLKDINELLEKGYSFTNGKEYTPVKFLIQEKNLAALSTVINFYHTIISVEDMTLACQEFLEQNDPIIKNFTSWPTASPIAILTLLIMGNKFLLAEKFANLFTQALEKNKNLLSSTPANLNPPSALMLDMKDMKHERQPNLAFSFAQNTTPLIKLTLKQIPAPSVTLLKVLFRFQFNINTLTDEDLYQASTTLLTHFVDHLPASIIENLMSAAIKNTNHPLAKLILTVALPKLESASLQKIYDTFDKLHWDDLKAKISTIHQTIDQILEKYIQDQQTYDLKIIDKLLLEGANPNLLLTSKLMQQEPFFVAEKITCDSKKFTETALTNAFCLSIDNKTYALTKALSPFGDIKSLSNETKSKLFIQLMNDKDAKQWLIINLLTSGINCFEILPNLEKSHFDIAIENDQKSVVKNILLHNKSMLTQADVYRAIPCLINDEKDNVPFIIDTLLRVTPDSKRILSVKEALLKCIDAATNMLKIHRTVIAFTQHTGFALFVDKTLSNKVNQQLWLKQPITKHWVEIVNHARSKMLELSQRSRVLEFNQEMAAFFSWDSSKPGVFKARDFDKEYRALCKKKSAALLDEPQALDSKNTQGLASADAKNASLGMGMKK